MNYIELNVFRMICLGIYNDYHAHDSKLAYVSSILKYDFLSVVFHVCMIIM
jgi:hypothetical protein